MMTDRISQNRPRHGLTAALLAVLCFVGPLVAGRAEALCADTTSDGYVTASDALAALRLAISDGYEAKADLGLLGDPDGLVTASDALAILTSAISNTIPDCAAAVSDRVLATTASCDFATGGLAEIDLDTFEVLRHKLGAVDADSVIRKSGARIFVLNRFRGSSVQEIDAGGALASLWGCSVGAGSNPHDIALVSDTKAYVSRYDATTLVIIDPSRGPGCKDFMTGSIDLSPWADDDGVPEMDQMVVVGNHLFVAIQRLDRFSFFRPAANAALVVVDINADEVVDVIELQIKNPFVQTKSVNSGLLCQGLVKSTDTPSLA